MADFRFLSLYRFTKRACLLYLGMYRCLRICSSSALNLFTKPLEIRMFQGVLCLIMMKKGQLRGKKFNFINLFTLFPFCSLRDMQIYFSCDFAVIMTETLRYSIYVHAGLKH